MAKIKTSELTCTALDWAVAMCEYPKLVYGVDIGISAHFNLIVLPNIIKCKDFPIFSPSSDWAQGGRIIEREGISLIFLDHKDWTASSMNGTNLEEGNTPLIVAMRCYVASKLGDEVEVPDELLNN